MSHVEEKPLTDETGRSRSGRLRHRLTRGIRCLYARPDWHLFLGPDWPEHIMDAQVTDRFHAKQGRSTGRWILEQEGRRLAVYLKRHHKLSWWRGLLATLWPTPGWSPAWQEYRNLEWATESGFPVPAVVAAGEFIGPCCRLQSVLAIEELTDMLPLHEAIPAAARTLDSVTFARWKAGLIAELARLCSKLHRLCYFHKDLYLCHFYVANADIEQIPDWRDRIHMIDLHRLARHRLTWSWWQCKDLAQLLYSSDVEGVTDRDRLRFWRCYLGAEKESWYARLVAWIVRFRWRHYRRHNAKRKRRSGQSVAAQG